MTQKGAILAIDTAMNGCGAGVWLPGGAVFSESRAMTSGQSEEVMPMAGRVLAAAGVDYADLSAAIVTLGPGAFTGLRIGLSAAKALGLALDIPVYGITTTQALAAQLAREKNPEEDICVLVETKREDFYLQVFSPGGRAVQGGPLAASADEIAAMFAGKSCVFAGDAIDRFRVDVAADPGWRFEEGYNLPSPGLIAGVVGVEGAGSPLLATGLEPVYLRAPDVSRSKKPQRRIAGSQDA